MFYLFDGISEAKINPSILPLQLINFLCKCIKVAVLKYNRLFVDGYSFLHKIFPLTT